MTCLLLGACSSDYHYANGFLRKFKHNKKNATEQIYVVLPHEVLHTNSSLNEVEDFPYLSTAQQDSVIDALTDLLDKVDDSIFLSQFNNAFLYTLSRARVPIVLVDNEGLLPNPDDNHLTVNIVQLEAEEFVQRNRSDFHTQKGTYYAYDYDLRHFSTNVWMKFDTRDSLGTVYFKNKEITDDFHGTVTALRNQKATLKTQFDRITLNDAYRTARQLGQECATLYIEKILTEYVSRQKGSTKSYFYYNPADNCIDVILPYEQGARSSFEKVE